MRAVIIGGGFAGTTVAHLLAREGWKVTIVERERNLGGGCRTFFHAGHPFTYGPRVYYGYSQKVWDWVTRFIEMRRFPFELRTLAHEPAGEDRAFWSYPPHEKDVPLYPRTQQIQRELAERDNEREPRDFEEYWQQKVGPTLYDMFVDHYSRKMWMIGDNKVFDIFKWSAKDHPMEKGSREAYKGSLLGYPVRPDGYNRYFEQMIDSPNIELIYGTRAQWLYNDAVRVGLNKVITGDVIINTGPIDDLVGAENALPYVGREFKLLVLPCEQVFLGDVRFCHYASPEDEWTRVTEFKKLTYHESPHTLLVLEKPTKEGRWAKLYPYLTKANTARVDGMLAELPMHVKSIGRLGRYKYTTIEQTIVDAFDCASSLLGKSLEIDRAEWKGIGDVSMMKNRTEKI